MTLLYAIYTTLVHKPLVKVLAERRSKTEGAVEKARADIAAAEARTAEYEQRLREARVAVFKDEEALAERHCRRARQLWLRHARKRRPRLKRRAGIENDKASAQAGLQAESGKLAAEIIRIVLRPGTAPASAGSGR